ncbi:MAG: efflux transporter outer membrane subunit [Proteobacteria bacterium]|nr:efflux transporter outer membrane subunit [Pseudomonadota bacterium]
MRAHRLAQIAALSAAIAALTGCAVGPDFARPAAPDTPRLTPATPTTADARSALPGGGAQRWAAGMDIPANWWTWFGSSALNALVAESLHNNPSVQSVQAALRVAREDVSAQRGAFWPQVSVDLNASRAKTAPELSPALNSGTSPYSLQTAQVLVSYSLDVFGGNRRQVESLAAQAESARFQLESARTALTANVVQGVVQAASLHDQLAALQRNVALQEEQLGIMRKQAALGDIAQAAVIVQEAALAQSQAQVPALRKQLAQQNDALAALLGRLPAGEPIPAFTLADLHLPDVLPQDLPSALIEQRADVRAAEAQMHAASAQVGVAISNRLPQIALTASDGRSATRFADLFASKTGFFGVAADIAQPLFQGGALLHRQRAAQAVYAAASAQYRATVIAAFQNVADTMQALQLDAEALRTSALAEVRTREGLDIARAQLSIGDVSYLSVLLAEQQYQQSVGSRVQAQANRYADTAALFLALGGGWWNDGNATTSPKDPSGKP